MSKTFRGWAEVEDWNIHRAFRRPAKRKSEIEWRKSALEEIEEWEQEDERNRVSDPERDDLPRD